MANDIKQLNEQLRRTQENLRGIQNEVINAANALTKALNLLAGFGNEVEKQTRPSRFKGVANVIHNAAKIINDSVNLILRTLRTGTDVVKFTFNSVRNGFNFAKGIIGRIISLFGNFGDRLKQVFSFGLLGSNRLSRGFLGLSGSAIELYSKIRLLQMAFNALFNDELIKKGQQLYSSVHSLATIAGPELADNTIKWAQSLEKAFGLSASSLLADLQQLIPTLYGLGMAGKDVEIAGRNLVIISRHLAFMGAAGGDVETVMNKIISGLRGMTSSIDDLGFSIRDAQMDAYLKKLKAMGGEFRNIATDFSKLTEEQRIYVRYAAIVDQYLSKYDFSSFIKSLDTVTGRVTLLREAFASLQYTIGSVFFQIFSYIAPYLTLFLNWVRSKIEELVAWINKVFNLNINLTPFAEMNGAVAKLNKGLGVTNKQLEDIEKSTSKVRGNLLAFDKLNVLTKSGGVGGSVGGVGGGGGFDYSKLMIDGLDKLNKQLEKLSESYLDTLRKKFRQFIEDRKKDFYNYIKSVTSRDDIDFGFVLDDALASIRAIWENIKGILKNMRDITASIFFQIASDMKAGALVNGVLELARAFTRLVKVLTDALKPILNEIYQTYLRPFVETLGRRLSTWIENLTNYFDKLADSLSSSEGFKKFRDTMTGIAAYLFGGQMSGEQSAAFERFRNVHPVLANILDIIKEIARIIKELWNQVLKPLIASAGEFVRSELLPWLKDVLGSIGDWLEKHGSKLRELIERLARSSWEWLKTLVSWIGKLMDILGRNPALTEFLVKGLIFAKVGSWAVGQLSGVLQILLQIRGLYDDIKGLNFGNFISKNATKLKIGAGVAGAAWGVMDAFNLAGRSEEILGKDRGKTAYGKILTGVSGFIGGTGKGLSGALAGAGKGALIGSVFGPIGTAIGGLAGGVLGAIGGENIAKGIDSVFKAVEKSTASLFDSIRRNATNAWNSITDGAKNVGNTISTKWNDLKTWTSDTWNSIREIGSNTWNSITQGVNNLGASVRTGFSNIKMWAENVWGNISSTVGGAWESIKSGAITLSGTVSGKFRELGGNISSAFQTAKNLAVAAWENPAVFMKIVNNIKGIFDTLPSKLFGIWETIKNNAINVLSGIGSAVGRIIESAKTALTSGWSKVTDYVSNLFKGSPKVSVPGTSVKVKSTSITHIPAFASGGSIKGGKLFIADEFGNPELIGQITGRHNVTDVANKDMITKAIKEAAREGMLEALMQYASMRGMSGSKIEIHNHYEGLTVADEVTKRSVAEALTPEIIRILNFSGIL